MELGGPGTARLAGVEEVRSCWFLKQNRGPHTPKLRLGRKYPALRSDDETLLRSECKSVVIHIQ